MTNQPLPKIKQILSDQFGISDNLINSQAKLIEDLNLSKLEITDLITIMASEFKLNFPEEIDVTTLSTVSDLINLIDQYSDEL